MESAPLKQTQTQVQVRVNSFIRSVYNWMAIGLGITGFVAYYVANTPSLVQLIFGNQILFFGLIIAEFGLVIAISARIQKNASFHRDGTFCSLFSFKRCHIISDIPDLYCFIHYFNIFYLCGHL